jgi:hypothetical protein
VLVAHFAGGLSWERLLTAPGAESPNATVLGICLGLAFGTPLTGTLMVGKSLGDALFRSRGGGFVTALTVIGVAAALIAATASPVISAFNASEWWRVAIAGISVAGAPLFAASYLFRWRQATRSVRRWIRSKL